MKTIAAILLVCTLGAAAQTTTNRFVHPHGKRYVATVTDKTATNVAVSAYVSVQSVEQFSLRTDTGAAQVTWLKGEQANPRTHAFVLEVSESVNGPWSVVREYPLSNPLLAKFDISAPTPNLFIRGRVIIPQGNLQTNAFLTTSVGGKVVTFKDAQKIRSK